MNFMNEVMYEMVDEYAEKSIFQRLFRWDRVKLEQVRGHDVFKVDTDNSRLYIDPLC